jgi:SAM-dependent methyltransferase
MRAVCPFQQKPAMEAESLLAEISAFCRQADMAESTFGRRAVNDGKFVGRLKYGGKVTTATVERVRAFIEEHKDARDSDVLLRGFDSRLTARAGAVAAPALPPEQNFRFYDNRQKYLMFVNTCSEKWVVADRVNQELEHIRPRPPAIRVFDAGVGDGTVLTRVMRSMHRRFAAYPFYIVGKEISLEDVRLALEKAPDRFFEHPATCLVMTNLAYAEAPFLTPEDPNLAARVVWKELALKGGSAAEFEEQITGLQGFLAENWKAKVSKRTGNPVYEKPVVLVIYREDHRFLLDQVLPKRGALRADFDLIIASQPYRARSPVSFKAGRVIAPLCRALAPGGRLLGIHSFGGDPGLEIIQRIWPGEQPFQTDRQAILRATKTELGRSAHHFNFIANSDAKALFRYDMHTLPGEIEMDATSIGTSTLLAAWNAATYVAQIEDQRLAEVMEDSAYLRATKSVLLERGGLWFFDESYVISRKRDL